MSKSVAQKALADLKCRTQNAYEALNTTAGQIPLETWKETLIVTNEIQVLIDAYEKQIELNKNQNIKIKNQKGIIRVLQRKSGDKQ